MLKGYKTVIFNVIMTAILIANTTGLVTIDAVELDVAGTLDAVETALIAVWGFGNLLLRAVTNTSIFDKDVG